MELVLEEVEQVTTDPQTSQLGDDALLPNSIKGTSYTEGDDEGVFNMIDGVIPS